MHARASLPRMFVGPRAGTIADSANPPAWHTAGPDVTGTARGGKPNFRSDGKITSSIVVDYCNRVDALRFTAAVHTIRLCCASCGRCNLSDTVL